jgi:plasmid stabilization system protein ParE
LNVRFETGASQQIKTIHEWWTQHRLAAPRLFADEVANAVARLTHDPLAGQPFRSQSVAGVRRILCSRSRYHLYYVVDDFAETVIILAVWGAVRGKSPMLRREER